MSIIGDVKRLDLVTRLDWIGTAVRVQFGRNPSLVLGGALFVLLVLVSVFAPLLTDSDPRRINGIVRLTSPGGDFLFGTDNLGRDMFARTFFGGRISLIVGVSVALIASIAGLFFGLIAGYFRRLDSIIMRVMDGIMAIPGILLAIALVAVTRPSVGNVIMAIAVTEIPRVVRLVRSVVLTLREQPYVDAATSVGTSTIGILHRHILPNAMAPLIVQATFICAAAVITEAYLSFLGAGTPSEIPSWGNMMAEGRIYFLTAPWIVLIPGGFLAAMVLSINIVGDGLRDMLDPRMTKEL